MTTPDLVDRVRASLVAGVDGPGDSIADAVREAMPWQSDDDVRAATDLARAELIGAGPLEPLLADPAVTDVLVNGARSVWIDRGQGLERVDAPFADDDAVRRLAVRLAAAAGRRLDPSSPFVDATLADGTRVHAALPPASRSGPCLSLRVLRRKGMQFTHLVAAGSMQPQVGEVIAAVLAARLAFVVTGGTGSGKTTLLGALLGLVDPAERLVVVEDSPELAPHHPHVLAMVTRPPNAEGAGEITLRDLVRQSLRMRPDRIVVGEVRGPEVVDLLAALNTGHDGGAATVHANAPSELPARLEALASTAGLSRDALHSQVLAALHAVIHVRRVNGTRFVSEIAVVDRNADDRAEVIAALTVADATVKRGPGATKLAHDLRNAGIEVPSVLVPTRARR